jgi:hypothetical protein
MGLTTSVPRLKAFFTNVELRFPLIEAMLTPVGVLGGLRSVLFFNVGAGGFNGQPFTVATWKDTTYQPLLGYSSDIVGNLTPVFGPPLPVSGFRLVDGRGSAASVWRVHCWASMHSTSLETLFNRGWETCSSEPGARGRPERLYVRRRRVRTSASSSGSGRSLVQSGDASPPDPRNVARGAPASAPLRRGAPGRRALL